jgi:hypothetical protein
MHTRREVARLVRVLSGIVLVQATPVSHLQLDKTARIIADAKRIKGVLGC